METDITRVSTRVVEDEQYERFYSPLIHQKLIYYNFRTPDGKLFTCISRTLANARARRDAWLKKNGGGKED